MPMSDIQDPGPVTPTTRPYRSHKIPACDFCRRRKSRCTQDLVDQPCLLCRLHGATCTTTTDVSQRRAVNQGVSRLKRQRVRKSKDGELSRSANVESANDVMSIEQNNRTSRSQLSATDVTERGTRLERTFQSQDALNHSGHIVGPAMARDAQVLEQYMSPTYNSEVSYARPNPYSVYSDDPRNPVVYMKVPRQRRIVPSGNGTPGFRQAETMEKIIEPLGSELFNIYFDNIQLPFPILDEKTVLEAYRQDGLPHTLVCEIYAVSLILWRTSTKIRAMGRQPPDIKYLWDLSVSALNDDFLAPNFSTVLACILDLLGRPITSITYNAVNVGRVVALAQSLGLNRNPLSWSLDHRQKSLRIRTWWGILIHDQWASLSHGTPPHVQPAQWDVPVPNIDTLLITTVPGHKTGIDARLQGAHSFIALCQLTVILGDILPLIYTFHIQTLENYLKALRRHETTLDEWEERLPLWLRPGSEEFDKKSPGALNLHLSFLVVRMCLCRIALQEHHRSDEADDREAKQFYQSRCRKAARAVINFVISLERADMDVFWLPYSAYHFTSAATLILRCALETESYDTAQECVASAKILIDWLQQAKDEANWDLADICLGQCAAVVEKLCDGQYLDQWRRNLPAPRVNHSTSGGDAASRVHVAVPRDPTTVDHSNVNEQPDTTSRQQRPTENMETTADGSRDAAAAAAAAGAVFPTSDLFSDVAMFDSTLGDTVESPIFPDLWQIPHMDEYIYRGF